MDTAGWAKEVVGEKDPAKDANNAGGSGMGGSGVDSAGSVESPHWSSSGGGRSHETGNQG